MRTLWLLLSSLLLLTTTAAQAWTYKGNGGYSVVCPNGAELLDYYEGRVIRNFKLNLGPPELPVPDKIKILLDRLAARSPQRAARYRLQYNDFLKEARFLSNIDLGEIGDADPIVVPAGCKPVPTINQRTPDFPGDPRYIVKLEIWNLLNNDSKAGLILHELIYRELQQETSINTRYFNSLLASEQFETLDAKTYLEISLRVGFKSENIQGVEVDLTAPYAFYPNGNLQFARPTTDSLVPVQGQFLTPLFSTQILFHANGQVNKLTTTTGFQVTSLNVPVFGELEWSTDGKLQKGELHPSVQRPFFLQSANWPTAGYQLELGRDWDQRLVSCRITLSSNGKIKTATPLSGSLWIEGKKYGVTRRDPTVFFEGGTPQTLYLSEPLTTTWSGKKWTFLKARDLQLSENGQLLCGTANTRDSIGEKLICKNSAH